MDYIKFVDYVYENPTKLSLISLVLLLLGSLLLSGFVQSYFIIVFSLMPLSFILLPNISKKLLTFKNLILPILGGFVLLFLLNSIYPVFNLEGSVYLLIISALLGIVLPTSLKKYDLKETQLICINFLIFIKILMLFLVLSAIVAVCMDLSAHSSASVIMYGKLVYSMLLVDPLRYMAIFLLGSSVGAIQMQKLKQK